MKECDCPLCRDYYAKKPPLGIMTRKLWLEQRQSELIEACVRYSRAKKEIPIEWLEELYELTKTFRGL